jgi:hypothetical protein
LNLDTALQLLGLLGDVGVLILATRARLYRITPVFCGYMAWCLLNDLLFFLVVSRYGNQVNFGQFKELYFRIYTVEMVPDSIFQFAVLVELGWAVLRPIRSSLPRRSMLILSLMFVAAAAVIWPISASLVPVAANLPKSWVLFMHMQQTVAILRVVIFMALAGFSQLLSIGWRNRELQIATGLGFYSMFSLAIWMIHSHQTISASRNYHILDQVGVAAYICSLLYWVYSFAQQEQERNEFTPEIRSFLLTVTGAARGTRVALAESAIGGHRKIGKG